MHTIRDIQVLRAIGVMMVVFAHRAILSPLENPVESPLYHALSFREGVDVFFVISGFVITKSLLPKLDGRASNKEKIHVIKSFWLRRIFRIIPSALLVALSAYAAGLVSIGQLCAAMFDYMNLYVAARAGDSIISHYWSLSLEEQFYILLPLAFFFPAKWRWRILLALMMVQFFLYRPVGRALWLLRSDALLAGCMLAVLESKAALYQTFLASHGRLLSIGLLLSICFYGAANQEKLFWCAQGFVTLSCAALVWIASFDRYMLPEGKPKEFLVWVGERSYSIYLLHPFCFLAASTFCPPIYVMRWLLGALLIAVLADLNFRIIESPLIRAGKAIIAKKHP